MSTPEATMSPVEIATASAEAMWAEDNASRGLGMRLERVEPGFALLSMAVTERMVNGHGLCHGGFIFTLADSAFAFACNSHNQRNVAQSAQITFVAPGRLGMRLEAEARERWRGERSGIYDVTVRAPDGSVIAEFRGMSRSIPGTLVPP
jgi:acyl-CoA thioesterase